MKCGHNIEFDHNLCTLQFRENPGMQWLGYNQINLNIDLGLDSSFPGYDGVTVLPPCTTGNTNIPPAT